MQNLVVVLGIPNSCAEEWAGGARLHVKQSTFSTEQPVLSNHGVPLLSGLLFWKLCLLGEGGSAPALSALQGQPLEVQALLLSLLLLSFSPALGSPGTAGASGTRVLQTSTAGYGEQKWEDSMVVFLCLLPSVLKRKALQVGRTKKMWLYGFSINSNMKEEGRESSFKQPPVRGQTSLPSTLHSL